MLLHTVNKSPFNSSCFNDCLRACADGSAILLIEDAVYAAKKGALTEKLITETASIKFYALEADVIARGIKDQLCENVRLTSDDDFVELVTQYDNVVSWY
jgi:tRNA 2-thiouridine synthesizing protein B